MALKMDTVDAAKDRKREQETLYILQNSNLMKQIAESAKTHSKRKGQNRP